MDDATSWLFANFDYVSFRVADFKKLSSAAILNRPGRGLAAAKILVRLFQIRAEYQKMIVTGVVPCPLDFRFIAEKDSRLVASRKL